MDIEKAPIQVFIKEALMRTPQGLVVISSFVLYPVLSILVYFFPDAFLFNPALKAGTLVLFIPWPLIVLIINVKLSSPNYLPSFTTALIVFAFAVTPLWWVYA